MSLALVAAALSWPAPASAEPTVIVVAADTRPAFQRVLRGFTDELASRGARVLRRDLTPEAVANDPLNGDLILALGSAATTAVLARRDRPAMVHAIVADPVRSGLMSPQGALIRGVASAPTMSEQLELIRSVAPNVARVGVLGTAIDLAHLAALEPIARHQGLTLVPLTVETPEHVALVIIASADRVDAILADADPHLWKASTLKAAVISSLRVRRPLFGFAGSFTKSGAIASLAAEDYESIGATCAQLAIEILAGRGAELPSMTQPRRVLSSINLVVADRLGIQPSRRAIDQASEVFR